jgi:hypothetical protein
MHCVQGCFMRTRALEHCSATALNEQTLDHGRNRAPKMCCTTFALCLCALICMRLADGGARDAGHTSLSCNESFSGHRLDDVHLQCWVFCLGVRDEEQTCRWHDCLQCRGPLNVCAQAGKQAVWLMR